MRFFLKVKNTGLILRVTIVGCSLSAGLLGWQVGAGSHAAATATMAAVPLLERARLKKIENGHAPPSWSAAPLETGRPAAAPLAQVPLLKPAQEHDRPAAGSRRVEAAAEEHFIPVDPAQPSNWMRAGEEYVSVQGYMPAAPGRGVALDVVLTPAAASSGGVSTASAGSTTAQSVSQTSAGAAPRPATGFTYDEQLFRSKWGWAAYAAAQRAAQWQP